MNLVREGRRQGKRHRRVTRRHGGLTGEGPVSIGIETLVRPRPAEGQLGTLVGRSGHQERDCQASAHLGDPLVVAHQPDHDEARGDRPIDLRLTEMADNPSHIVRSRPPIILSEALRGTIEQHERRETTDGHGAVPPPEDRLVLLSCERCRPRDRRHQEQENAGGCRRGKSHGSRYLRA